MVRSHRVVAGRFRLRRAEAQRERISYGNGSTTRYDYVFAEAGLAPRLRDCHVVKDLPGIAAASDHYPLVAEFELDA